MTFFQTVFRGKTNSDIEKIYYPEQINEAFKPYQNEGLLSIVMSHMYWMALVFMVAFVVVFFYGFQHPKRFSGKVRKMFETCRAEWSWPGFWIFVIFEFLVSLIWMWRHLHLDMEYYRIFGQDVLPGWAFLPQTVCGIELLGMTLEDLIYLMVTPVIFYIGFRIFRVNTNLSQDFKYKYRIGLLFIGVCMAVSVFCYFWLDYSARITVEVIGVTGIVGFSFSVNKINIKNFFKYVLAVLVSVDLLWDFVSVSMFPALAKKFGWPTEHWISWYYRIPDGDGGYIHSVLFNSDQAFWIFDTPVSILVVMPLLGVLFFTAVITHVESILSLAKGRRA